jgi:RHS repeat-associated protein
LTDNSGTAIATQDYYPYGEKLASYSNPGKYTYNGKEYMDDWGFNLYYYGARYMDPTTGRFITPDPVKDYLNQYSYVGNNPVNRIDPTGMFAVPTISLAMSGSSYFSGFRINSDDSFDNWFASSREFTASQKEAQEKKWQEKQEKRLRNLIDEAKKKALKLADEIGGDWSKIAEMLDKISSYKIVFVDKIEITIEGVKNEGEAEIDSKNKRLIITKALMNDQCSDTFIEAILIHEAYHNVIPDISSNFEKNYEYEEPKCQEIQMSYYDRFGPPTGTYNTLSTRENNYNRTRSAWHRTPYPQDVFWLINLWPEWYK